MKADGLYRVLVRGICAGIVVEGGRIVRCAPILRRQAREWLRYAEYVGP